MYSGPYIDHFMWPTGFALIRAISLLKCYNLNAKHFNFVSFLQILALSNCLKNQLM